MNIAVVGTIASSIYGFRSGFIQKLTKEGHVVFAFAIDYDDGAKNKVEALGAIPVDYKLSRYGVNPFRDIIDTISLAKKLRKLNVQVSFYYFVKPVIYGAIASKIANVQRSVGMLEGLGYVFTQLPGNPPLKQRILKAVQIFLYKLSIPLLDQLIVLNPDDKKDLVLKHNIGVRECKVLGGIGLQLNDYPFSKPECYDQFIFIGRLLVEKGINEFLDAAEIVKVRFPKSLFIILGETEPESKSSVSLDRLERLTKEGVVQYLGQVDNVLDYLSKSSVFVLPSYREGVPRSTQEAMAIGRPVITTDVPGCRETVVDNVTGFLIPPFDAGSIAEKMIYFLENPDSIKKMGQSSYKYAVDNFDASKINDKLYHLVLTDS